MSTPQDTLYRLSYQLKDLKEEFYQKIEIDGEETTICLFDEVRKSCKDIESLKKDIEDLKNTMSLILKVMNDKGKK